MSDPAPDLAYDRSRVDHFLALAEIQRGPESLRSLGRAVSWGVLLAQLERDGR